MADSEGPHGLQGIVVYSADGETVGPTVNREAWKVERRDRIGSSDAGALFGVDPYTTPWDVWDRIVLGDWKDLEGADIRRGRKQERIALETFAERTGLEVEALPMVAHPDDSALVTDLDGILLNSGPAKLRWIDGTIEWPEQLRSSATWAEVIGRARGPGALEVKVPRVARFFKLKEEGLDPSHLTQTQHHLMVAGLEWGFFGFYTPEFDDLITFPVFRDDEFCRWLFAAEVQWIADHVATRRRPERPLPPPPRWPTRVPGEADLRDDDEWMERADLLVRRWWELADAQTQYDDTEEHLLELVGEEDRHLAGGGVTVKKKQSAQQRRLDVGKLRAAIQLARSAGDTARLLEIDPDADEWKFTTASNVKTEVKVRAPNPYELQQVRK